jgi:uncharacterized repeat protein (TIGR02543 family)
VNGYQIVFYHRELFPGDVAWIDCPHTASAFFVVLFRYTSALEFCKDIEQALTADTTLYVKWTDASTYTVTYNGNGNTGGAAPSDTNSPYGSGATVTVLGNTGNLEKTSHTFDGWNTQADGSGTDYAANATFTITGNTTLYAKWTGASTYTVTYDADGGNPASQTKTVNDGASVGVSDMPDNPTRSGYIFAGWYTGANGTGTQFTADTTVDGDITVYAKWASAVPGSTLQAALDWLDANAEEGGEYTIVLSADETIGPKILSYGPDSLIYPKKKVSITLKGDTAERTVSLSGTGSLFTLDSGATLILDNNITLQGQDENTDSLVQVNRGGTLVMNAGSKITGNRIAPSDSSSRGGGVYVSYNATFTMTGGTISGNTALSTTLSYGGGVYAMGTFTMTGGTISGNFAIATTLFSSGGGVYAAGTFTMTGGTISGNVSSASYPSSISYGGGVYVEETFTMTGGIISGNTASSVYALTSLGGGVYVSPDGTFTKQGGGTIYGSNAGDTLKNTAVEGHAVYVTSDKKRDSTAGAEQTLDSGVNGSAGGWTVSSGSISNITYSFVSGGSWTLESDGRRKSPRTTSITGGETMSRVSFTSTGANASITIQLEISSQRGDYAFISTLDNANATASSGYYQQVSYMNPIATITIPVPTAGRHFVEIGYEKNSLGGLSSSDCAWFKVLE